LFVLICSVSAFVEWAYGMQLIADDLMTAAFMKYMLASAYESPVICTQTVQDVSISQPCIAR